VNRVLLESLLRLEPTRAENAALREIGSKLLRHTFPYPGASDCAAIAPLILLRFGDRRSLPLLQRCFENKDERVSSPCVRASAIVFASYGPEQAGALRRAASRMLRNHLSEMVKMLDAIEEYQEVPKRFLQRINTNYDPVSGQMFLDMRSLITARLLGLNRRPKVKVWLTERRKYLLGKSLSQFDQELIKRLWPA
jgi:hypothetical protein